jgi:recombination endonuclease VII
MAMSMQERKAKQRANPLGYAKSRMTSWKCQGINPITWDEFEARLETQHNECAICHASIDARAALDHDHQSGDSRGVLCSTCNLLLGRVEGGSLDFFLNAAAYLRKWEVQQ